MKECVARPLYDWLHFSSIIHKLIMQAKVGEVIHLKKEFAPNSTYSLTAELKELDFDPAKADRLCW